MDLARIVRFELDLVSETISIALAEGEIDPDEIDAAIEKFVTQWWRRKRRRAATSLSMYVRGGPMAVSFTVDTTDGAANLQFTDDHGDPVEGPLDSVSGAPVAPVVVSDNAAALTAAAATESGGGAWSAPLTPVAVGDANVSVAPLSNSDGSPVLESAGANAGQPFETPDAVAVSVLAGPAGDLSLSVTG